MQREQRKEREQQVWRAQQAEREKAAALKRAAQRAQRARDMQPSTGLSSSRQAAMMDRYPLWLLVFDTNVYMEPWGIQIVREVASAVARFRLDAADDD